MKDDRCFCIGFVRLSEKLEEPFIWVFYYLYYLSELASFPLSISYSSIILA